MIADHLTLQVQVVWLAPTLPRDTAQIPLRAPRRMLIVKFFLGFQSEIFYVTLNPNPFQKLVEKVHIYKIKLQSEIMLCVFKMRA